MRKFNWFQIIVMMILFSFLSLAAVVFTPAYPLLSREFRLGDSQAQWMMTLFLLGSAIGRLPYGPLANRFGRKKTLWIGLVISVIGTLITLYGSSYSWLCIGRFIQALGCAVTLKIGYTIVGDLYSGAEVTKVLSYSMLVYAILPGIGTAVSGYLVPSFGWRGGFWFFLFFTFFLMASTFSLPETLKQKDHQALRVKNILSGYGKQFKNLYLILWSCLMGLTTAVLFIFSQEAPFVAIDLMGMKPEQYGVFYLVPAFGIAAGSFATAWLSDKMTTQNGMLLGIAILFFSSLAMGGLFLSGWVNGWALFLPQIFVQFGDAILYTNASSQGMTEAKDKSNAASIMLFISSLGSVAGTFIVGIFAPRALMTLPAVFLIATAIMFLIWIKLRTHCKAEGA